MRETRKQQAEQTLEALERGAYRNARGEQVVLADALRACVAHTRCYSAEAVMRLEVERLGAARQASAAVIEVTQETTLQASARLARGGEWRRVGVLNFASARHPGGGFQSGAQAQEESLARASGLFASLSACPEFYAAHQRERSLLYSDRMIHSPACPVFRTDDGAWLETPYSVDVVTSPAPNAGALHAHDAPELALVPDTVRRRSGRVLALLAHAGCDALVLGAWGCGVFGNDPHTVAAAFAGHLEPGSPLVGRFDLIVFAVYDTQPERNVYRAFHQQFATHHA